MYTEFIVIYTALGILLAISAVELILIIKILRGGAGSVEAIRTVQPNAQARPDPRTAARNPQQGGQRQNPQQGGQRQNPAAQPQTAPVFMTCPRCGANFQAGARACPRCGSPVR